MLRFLGRRLISSAIALFLIATITFFIMFLVPGGPFLSEKTGEDTVAIMNAKYGLDKPVTEQYANYMKNLAQGDLGISIKRPGYTVNEIIAEKFPVSAGLGAAAILLAVLAGVPLGAVAARRHNRAADRIIMFFSTFAISIPGFVIATVLLYFFGTSLKILPTVGLKSALHYIMPSVALALMPMGHIARLTRSAMLETLNQDYIRTARGRGISERRIVFKHALRNSIIPVITYIGPLAATVLTGGFVVEKVFSIPGLGQYFVNSISGRDYPMIMGTTIFLAALLIVINLIIDILYGVIDPRARVG